MLLGQFVSVRDGFRDGAAVRKLGGGIGGIDFLNQVAHFVEDPEGLPEEFGGILVGLVSFLNDGIAADPLAERIEFFLHVRAQDKGFGKLHQAKLAAGGGGVNGIARWRWETPRSAGGFTDAPAELWPGVTGARAAPTAMAVVLFPVVPGQRASIAQRRAAVYGGSMAGNSMADRLAAVLGAGKVTAAPGELGAHSGDKWFAAHPPEVVVFAETTADVAAVLRFAHDEGIPVTARGAGVGYVGGCVPVRGGIALSLARMNRIREIALADGVAVVEPGVVTGDLQAAVRARGWYYPPDPASLKDCSLGGNIATNAGGPKCLKYGVTRHYVLGLEVVLADGTVARVGGRCHKNKTGFDLVGLFVGSEGMLGVVTEATLRLIPHPPARAGLTATFATFAEAAAAVQAIFQAGHLPAALEISDQFTIAAARRRLGPDALPPGEVLLMLEVDGRPAAVREEAAEIEALLEKLGALAVRPAADEATVERLWEQRREFSYSLRDTGLTKLNEDVVVPRGRLVELVAFCESLQTRTGIAVACFGHAGDGNIHVNLMVGDMGDPKVAGPAEEALDQLFRFIIGIGGAITGEHGIGLAKRRWFADAVGPGALGIHRRLKAAMDPSGILNPGKFLETEEPAG